MQIKNCPWVEQTGLSACFAPEAINEKTDMVFAHGLQGTRELAAMRHVQ
ncbi:MAG: hypothetical protein QNJ78_12395 [Gammaproteobacteria bacterium]|nr:hypothetical protein [Gammaproteobacteria bacterium]